MVKVAFQGEKGAYSEAAIAQKWGREAQPLPRRSFEQVFLAVETGEADVGLLPIENTLEGSIAQNYNLLYGSSLGIQGEVIYKVVHCLIANRGVSLKEIKRVYSHPQALGQTTEYLRSHGFEPVNFYDTAGAVKMLREEGFKDAGAVAGRVAAEIYGMTVLEEGIESNPANYTRFLMIGIGEHPPTGEDKTTLAFASSPNTLVKVFSQLLRRGANLRHVESRPLVGRPWEYIFFLDLDGHYKEAPLVYLIEDLKNISDGFKILGSYPKAHI